MPLEILAPLSGRVVAFADVPDPVFAGGFLGPGLAIDPVRAEQSALAPVSGTIASLFAHAFGIATPDGREILVHLGIETVAQRHRLHAAQAKGDSVVAGEPVVTWIRRSSKPAAAPRSLPSSHCRLRRATSAEPPRWATSSKPARCSSSSADPASAADTRC